MSALFEMTALPNLHPAVVHFPIALAAAALVFDAIVFVGRRGVRLDRGGALLWGLAAAGAGVAYVAGRDAAEHAGALELASEATLAAHADWALATLVGLGLLALLRAALAWRDSRQELVRRGLARSCALLGALALQLLVARTADLGGALVYRHGVAVARPPAPISLPRPSAGDGLTLPVSGRVVVELSDFREDAQIEVQLDTMRFEGSVALGAFIEGREAGTFFRLRTSGGAALVARRNGKERILDEQAVQLSEGAATIGLSIQGRHWKGFLDGRSVAHGHASLASPGRLALLLEGRGTLGIIAIRISALAAESDTTRKEQGT